MLNPPPVLGLGQGAGYSLFVEDRAGAGFGALQHAVNALQTAAVKTPGMGFPFVGYQSNVPQLDIQVDRVKAKAQGVALTDLFDTLQVYLGSAYVNDFNLFGRTWRVYAQADGDFRKRVEDIANLKTRNDKGEMVPIGSMVKISQTYGPDPVLRYNGYPAADFIGEANPAMLSSAQAMATMAELARRVLPNGMTIEWTDLSFQEASQGNAALLVFPAAVLLAFLVLAALYESWVLALAVILIVPMCMLSALAGVKLYGSDNNTFVQVGLVVLMGLACKNAILIVEFARELEFQGKGIVEAALEACRLRLRPIVMTSVAFIAGTIPLVLSHGAGAEVSSATGVTVFAGMIGVTLFGLFLTPVFYVGLRKLVRAQADPARRGQSLARMKPTSTRHRRCVRQRPRLRRLAWCRNKSRPETAPSSSSITGWRGSSQGLAAMRPAANRIVATGISHAVVRHSSGKAEPLRLLMALSGHRGCRNYHPPSAAPAFDRIILQSDLVGFPTPKRLTVRRDRSEKLVTVGE